MKVSYEQRQLMMMEADLWCANAIFQNIRLSPECGFRTRALEIADQVLSLARELREYNDQFEEGDENGDTGRDN